MMEKAIMIATSALEFILKSYPADDVRYADLHSFSKTLLLKFEELTKELKAVEHEQKSTAYPKKCPCRTCDPEAKADGELMEQCVKDAVKETITGVETVYDAEANVDTTGMPESGEPVVLTPVLGETQ